MTGGIIEVINILYQTATDVLLYSFLWLILDNDCLLGTVRKFLSNATYIIEDSLGDIYKIERNDIISDEDDADNIIQAEICFLFFFFKLNLKILSRLTTSLFCLQS